MRRLGMTLARLKALSDQAAAPLPMASARLRPLGNFGSNPGALDAWSFVPASDGPIPLVVVLHGCTQNAAGYDRGSGWSELAERHGFAVLYPEQRRANNPNACFSWFQSADSSRDSGEPLSIRQMIDTLVADEAIDQDRIYVTGLSAGGAMTSIMLAAYPELFAGGAIIAGLPFGAASTIPEAFERMRGSGHADDAAYTSKVRAASDHRGRWPTVSVWHGSADATVAPVNADAIVGQWRALHGAGTTPDRTDVVDGFPRRVWLDADGREAIEEYRITGMGHGTPLDTGGEDGIGTAIPHMLDVGISSTRHIADRWDLLGTVARQASAVTVQAKTPPPPPPPAPRPAARRPLRAVSGVQATIEAALRSAGLMR